MIALRESYICQKGAAQEAIVAQQPRERHRTTHRAQLDLRRARQVQHWFCRGTMDKFDNCCKGQ
jgi:hypothetical protein